MPPPRTRRTRSEPLWAHGLCVRPFVGSRPNGTSRWTWRTAPGYCSSMPTSAFHPHSLPRSDAGWSHDPQLRLLKRANARYDESGVVHEVAQLDGSSDSLSEPLLHLNYDT